MDSRVVVVSESSLAAGAGSPWPEGIVWCVRPPAGAQGRRALALNLVFVLSLILVGLAVVGVFIEIPFVSNYAFWVAIAAYIMLAGTHK